MKKFSKILENSKNEKTYLVDATLKLIIKSTNEGEAGYLADSILGGIEEMHNYEIINLKEIDEYWQDSNNIIMENGEIPGITTDEKIEKTWEAEFGDRTPTTTEKMEFYHRMRNAGIDGIRIFKVLQGK